MERSSPASFFGLRRLGAIQEVNDLAAARAEYEAAVAARGAYVPARIQLGVTLLALGEAELAEEQWKKALEIDAENTHAKMYLRMLGAQRAKGSIPPAA